MRDRLVQVRIEFLSLCLDWLQSIFGEEIVELFQYESHPGINGRLFAFPFRCLETKLKIVHNRHQPLEQRAVGVFDRLFFFARRALFVILEVGLASQREVAKPIEVGLQASRRILHFTLLRVTPVATDEGIEPEAADCSFVCSVQ